MILEILKKIKKLKVKEVKDLAKRIEIISNRPSTILQDLNEALNCCNYHFYGKNYYHELCPCQCYCKNCEWIPMQQVLVRMQEIAKGMTEENVFNEFIEKYGKKEKNLRESGQTSNTNDVSTNS